MPVYVLNPWELEGYLRFELSYAKPTRRHLCQLEVVVLGYIRLVTKYFIILSA